VLKRKRTKEDKEIKIKEKKNRKICMCQTECQRNSLEETLPNCDKSPFTLGMIKSQASRKDTHKLHYKNLKGQIWHKNVFN
jgi:hypothetical protein